MLLGLFCPQKVEGRSLFPALFLPSAVSSIYQMIRRGRRGLSNPRAHLYSNWSLSMHFSCTRRGWVREGWVPQGSPALLQDQLLQVPPPGGQISQHFGFPWL